jgi:Peptidase family M23
MRKAAWFIVIGTVAVCLPVAAQIALGPVAPGLPLVAGVVSQKFNVAWSENPAQQHTGVDIAVAKGTPVYSAYPGVVAKVGDLGGGWGQYVVVQNDKGDANAYLHINPSVKGGDRVNGPLGTVLKDHLHYNRCPTVKGCQHGAFPNPTYPNLAVAQMTKYYSRPAGY